MTVLSHLRSFLFSGRAALLAAGSLVSFVSHAADCTDPPVSGRAYYVVNEASGLYLDVAKKSMTDGADVIQWQGNSQSNQQWVFSDAGNGQWTLRAVHSERVLDVYGWSTRAGDPVKQWTATKYANQNWTVARVGKAFTITSAYSNQLLTADDQQAGTPIVQRPDQSSAAQRWHFTPVDGQCSTPLPPTASAGCGTAARFASGRYSLSSNGVTREFLVSMPSQYDAKSPLPLVVGLHWRGGNATNVVDFDFYGLKKMYGNGAIFVAPEGLDAGWANSGDRDIQFMRAMVGQLQGGLCVDKSRVYATGFSFGGMMSNAIGCQMGDTFRAIAPIAGSLWSGCAESTNRVAAILIHAKEDNVVGYQFGEEARDKFVQRNACTKSTRSIGKNGCVEYTGCESKYPVAWCGYSNGQHWPPAFAGEEIKAFFDRF